MDVYLLYFTLHNPDPNGLTSWGAIVVEDGEMESFVGSGASELESLLDGLTKCLEQIPSTLPIVIRTRNRTVLQLGKRWLDTWQSDGWETEEHSELISALMEVLETRRVEWFTPNYLDHLDKTVVEYALEEWNFQQENSDQSDLSEDSSDHTEDDIAFDKDDITKTDSADMENSTASELIYSNQTVVTEDNTKERRESYESETISHTEQTIEHTAIDPSSTDSMTETMTSHEIKECISEVPTTVDTDHYLNELLPTEEPSVLDLSNIADQGHDTSINSNNVAIDPTDQAKYPYIDDDGWRQLHTLFQPPFQEIEQHHPTRIVAYVTANHHHDLAAWSFALIDMPSRMAFFKAVGHRHSTQNRALLQGCISLLNTIKSASHHVECRVQDPDLASLLERLIDNPYAMIEDDIWMMESAFVSQLSYWLEQRTVTVNTISQDQSDLASQMVHHFSQQRLSALNYGDSAEFSLRRTRFPLERLIN